METIVHMDTEVRPSKRHGLDDEDRSDRLKQEECRHKTGSKMLAAIAVRAVVASFTCLLLASASHAPVTLPVQLVASYQQENCNANDQLHELAGRFIVKCRQASIYRVFPAQHLGNTLGEIKKGSSASHKRAWKLLNDGRFKKDKR